MQVSLISLIFVGVLKLVLDWACDFSGFERLDHAETPRQRPAKSRNQPASSRKQPAKRRNQPATSRHQPTIRRSHPDNNPTVFNPTPKTHDKPLTTTRQGCFRPCFVFLAPSLALQGGAGGGSNLHDTRTLDRDHLIWFARRKAPNPPRKNKRGKQEKTSPKLAKGSKMQEIGFSKLSERYGLPRNSVLWCNCHGKDGIENRRLNNALLDMALAKQIFRGVRSQIEFGNEGKHFLCCANMTHIFSNILWTECSCCCPFF